MTRTSRSILFMILCLGLYLRLHRIGAQLFWVDELGVAEAAMTPELSAAVQVARGHVMAMPLDYVIAWFMGRFSTVEGWLRLPEAVWGTLTLAAGYLLYMQVLEKRTALLGTFLLALSPVLIQYSQELRFYAPLVFFYTSSTAAGLKASREGKAIYWLAFSILTLAGVFFHIYTVLTLIPVGIWVFAQRDAHRGNLRSFFTSVLFILLGTEIGVLNFGSFPGETSVLFAKEPPFQVILGGLGWWPTFPATGSAAAFGLIGLISALAGIYSLTKSNRGHIVRDLLVGIGLQILLVLGMDSLKHYFASARQLIMLVPFAVLLSAAGIEALLQKAQAYSGNIVFRTKLIDSAAIVAICVLAFPALQQYYSCQKGATRSILRVIDKGWQRGQAVYVTPGYNRDLYAYYANRLEDNPELAVSFIPWEMDDNPAIPPAARFLVTEPSFDGSALGYNLGYSPPIHTLYPQTLWIKR